MVDQMEQETNADVVEQNATEPQTGLVLETTIEPVVEIVVEPTTAVVETITEPTATVVEQVIQQTLVEPVAEPVVEAVAKPVQLIAEKMWSSIKDLDLQLFALPGQPTSKFFEPLFIEPELFLKHKTSTTAALIALEEALPKDLQLRTVDKYVVISKKVPRV